MEHDEEAIEQELNNALGKPKYYVDAEGKKAGERYYWFPNQGNSMTDNTDQSIPGGALVLGRWLPVTHVQDIPLHQPIVVIFNDNEKQICLLKTICRIVPDAYGGSGEIWLRSYNPIYDDFPLPFSCVKFIFITERVRRPDGTEFIPQQHAMNKKRTDSY
jgi:hypothetical protein